MVKNRRKTFIFVFAVSILIITLSVFCLSSYAALPIVGDTQTTVIHVSDPVSSVSQGYAVSLVKEQWRRGSFNNYRPVLLYFYSSGASSEYRLIISDPTYGNNPNAQTALGYQSIGDIFEPVKANPSSSASVNVNRMLMTDKGFARYYNSSAPSVSGEYVLGYWDVDLNDFVVNNTYLSGTSGDIFYNVYTAWAQSGIADYGPTYSEGYAVGYDEGYDVGYTRGEDAGYRNGMYDGTHAEGIQLDVGGVIDSVIGGARTIITNAFGFELFGINIAGILVAVTVVFVIGFIIKKIKGD